MNNNVTHLSTSDSTNPLLTGGKLVFPLFHLPPQLVMLLTGEPMQLLLPAGACQEVTP